MKILEKITHALESLVTGEGSNTKLSRLDFGILEVALMISALDGEILPAEIAAFRRLLQKCRGYSHADERTVFAQALRKAGYQLALAQVGDLTEEERIAAFVEDAVTALPLGFAAGRPVDIRRAFVTWIAMGISDGEYSALERKAVDALKKAFTEIKVTQAIQDSAAWMAAYPGYKAYNPYLQSVPELKTVKLLEDGFLEKAEAHIRELDAAADPKSAETALLAIINL